MLNSGLLLYGKEFLNKYNYILSIKLHPLTKGIIVQENERVKNCQDMDTQFLMKHSSIVITDYSSTIMDYSLLNRKIVLYAPDFEEYIIKEGLFEESRKIYNSDYICCTPEEVIERIKNDDDRLSKKINEIFNLNQQGQFCKRIVDEIRKI